MYQIYPRSFCDSDGDGVGDLNGVRAHFEHLAWLGVDAIWLSPFFPSPMRDYGYDVADYCAVDPLFGTLADFDALVAEAHALGIRVLIDWVPNHTSDLHPWFVDARSSRDSARRSWYVWRDGRADTPPNNWRATFSPDSPAWTWDETTAQWYLHVFLPEQPDLDWHNAEVRAEMAQTLRFWLDRGVDGFRMDVVHLVGKDVPLEPPGERTFPAPAPLTHDILRELRRLLDGYEGDRVAVGEVYILSTRRVAEFYGDGDELHLAFNFPPLYAPWEAEAWRTRVQRVVEELDPRAAWPTWVLSNHDNPRHRTRFGTEARARAAAVLLLTLRGTPFLYAGEELGLEDAAVPPDRVVDPGGRDGCRAPVPWEASPTHGWAAAEPWLPWPPQPTTRNAATLRADETSILHLYRRLLAVRRSSSALRVGSWRELAAPDGVLAYERADGDEHVAVLVNFASEPCSAPVGHHLRVAVASDGRGEGGPYDGGLGADQAVVLVRD